MTTPVADFVYHYAARRPVRLHMPGHKGVPFLGCEGWDITEISGAGSLYDDSSDTEAGPGILAESEANAAALFGTAKTLYSTEGSSQCIRAMVTMAALCRKPGTGSYLLAGRNAHKSLLYGAALADMDLRWIWPRNRPSICGCAISPSDLAEALDCLDPPPAAVFLTSPDYLGGQVDVAGCAEVCHAREIPLLVDNAHGAYLRFLPESRHPMDLGADACCDSAHKTLPVLTGGACLHLSRHAPEGFVRFAREAMALHGSTSPSWLTLVSLDLCNRYLSGDYRERLAETVRVLGALRKTLRENGYAVEESDPLKMTLRGNPDIIKQRLRQANIEWEYADRDYLVLMAAPENAPKDLDCIATALGRNPAPVPPVPMLPTHAPERVLSVRQAIFAPHRRFLVEQAEGQVCASPTVGCPPAVPLAAAGERLDRDCMRLFRYYGISSVEVVDM